MNRKHKIYLTLSALLAVLLLYWIYVMLTPTSPEQAYRLEEAKTGNVTQTVSANGTLNPVTLVNVGTQVSGTVKKLYVDFNSKVNKGQVLLELDSALLEAQARQSEANLKNAKVTLDNTMQNHRRGEELIGKGYIPQQELDQLVQARNSALAQYELAQAQLDKDRVNLAYTIIRSPVSGVVIDRVVDVGQTVAASFQTPTLIKIAENLSKMQINSSFAEADIGTISIGQEVRFNVDAFANRQFQGVVQQIRLNATVQQNVVTYDVVVGVDNKDQALLPGMTAYVSIIVAQQQDVLLVPNAALRFRPPAANADAAGGKRQKKKESATGTVHVLSDNQLKPVNVTLGITDNRFTEITSGDLKAGDKVVTGEATGAERSGSSNPLRIRMF